MLLDGGVRWSFRNISSAATQFSQDLEPEYITVNDEGTKAYVALQVDRQTVYHCNY